MQTSTKIQGIILVDDDSITNYLNSELIREMEIATHVVVCNCGEEALDYLRRQQNPLNTEKSVTLIFLDINMPGIDGFEFLNHLEQLKLPEGVDVVLLTTSDNPKDVEKTSQFKIRGYLNKPLTTEKVNSIVNKTAH
ncbi:response regulator [Catalinimonas niigatensis]|uniref:response regulator n=1 Tax=Catalinimonas niigatensis TaxID=1397264 RepID=UPI00266716C2|nr:response regulator [Catalinimonas niigatensis]WPP50031.1 response regulator [Catalinimonas niigatensis]